MESSSGFCFRFGPLCWGKFFFGFRINGLQAAVLIGWNRQESRQTVQSGFFSLDFTGLNRLKRLHGGWRPNINASTNGDGPVNHPRPLQYSRRLYPSI